ncbi:MAG: hypothetical protein K2M01_00370, partial [Paramuribaculum sp.]|nr:hypothetical protein [Paramuribaculum sp.]
EIHRISGFRPWHIIPVGRFTVTDSAYLRYVRLWTRIWPARRLYYLFRGKVNGLRAGVRSIFKKR